MKRNIDMRKLSSTEKAIALAQRKGIIRPRDLEQAGIAREYVLRLMRRGVLYRSGRGMYELAEASPTEHHSLALVAKEAPRAVVCLLSALRYHELTTQQPSEVWIGIPTSSWYPKVSSTAYQVVRYSDATIQAGVDKHRIEGVDVRIFNPAKTVADCFKYRSRVGLDVAMEALQDALRQRKATVDEIEHFASVCRVAKVMRPYIEASV